MLECAKRNLKEIEYYINNSQPDSRLGKFAGLTPEEQLKLVISYGSDGFWRFLNDHRISDHELTTYAVVELNLNPGVSV